MYLIKSDTEFSEPITFIVVGAGGTGMRLISALAKVVRPGDTVCIVDPDIFEQRNIFRQHCCEADIGRPKALVAVERYSVPDVEFRAYIEKYEHAGKYNYQNRYAIVIGCVDSSAARRTIRADLIRNMPSAIWVDMGNEISTGQVLLGVYGWYFSVIGFDTRGFGEHFSLCDTMGIGFPQILADPPTEEIIGCGNRLDLQTVQVNMMAASIGLNYITNVITRQEFGAVGTIFSTENVVSSIVPVAKLDKFPYGDAHLSVKPKTNLALLVDPKWLSLDLPNEVLTVGSMPPSLDSLLRELS